ncbi:GIY-YIG nuclease family protein [Desulfoglaeba alkanexedens]|uniref:GIY-YIG nuclease family protein n=1 Tax=Desulfoglaeba alkanexedens ALDC TaxID=980445 RepID=A0A4P8L005_9BACT|nr:GIY-YIG nuclease family protein [Desulfoglaeba alkanexedens ALDC]
MKSKPGTYALVLRSLKSTSAQIGRWGQLRIVPGYYIYVGSAFGPGGVQARITRHCRKTKPKHWHIDYLREHVNPLFAWYSNEPIKLEHRWAQALSEMEGTSPVRGFGSTDCRCLSHLFVMKKKPSLTQFASAVGSPIETWVFRPDT